MWVGDENRLTYTKGRLSNMYLGFINKKLFYWNNRF